MSGKKLILNLQTVAVIVVALVALFEVPHNVLRPIVAGIVGVAIAVAFGARAYQQRLYGVVDFLKRTRPAAPGVLNGLLTPFELRLWMLGEPVDAGHAIGAILRRREIVLQLAMSVALIGIAAFVVAIVVWDL